MSEEGYEEEWNEGDEWNDSYDGYWAENQAIGPYEDLYYLDDYGYFQRNRKGKGKGKKGKKGKDDEGKGGEQGGRKGKSNYVQPQTYRLLPYRVNNNNKKKKKLITLQHEAKGMVSLQLQKLTQHMWMF